MTLAKDNTTDFAKTIAEVIKKSLTINQDQLRKEFNWERYAISLSSLLNK